MQNIALVLAAMHAFQILFGKALSEWCDRSYKAETWIVAVGLVFTALSFVFCCIVLFFGHLYAVIAAAIILASLLWAIMSGVLKGLKGDVSTSDVNEVQVMMEHFGTAVLYVVIVVFYKHGG